MEAYVYDIAAALAYFRYPWVGGYEPEISYAELEEALLEGYASHRPVPDHIETALPVCLLARLMILVQWVLDEMGDVDATEWSRGAVTNTVDLFRHFNVEDFSTTSS